MTTTSELELRDALFAYFEEREDMEVRRYQRDPAALESLIERTVRFARGEIVDWNEYGRVS